MSDLRIPPLTERGEAPRYHIIDEYRFQDLACELLGVEPCIEMASLYGTRGQGQHGIDVIGYRKEDDGIEVIQCKKYQRFSKADLKKASEEFLEYWLKTWAKRKVKRFVLCVACELSTTQIHEQILEEKKRFKKKNVIYDVWAAPDITRKLQKQREIVARFFPEYWVRELCGEYSSGTLLQEKSSDRISKIALKRELENVAALLSKKAKKGLESAIRQWKKGNRNVALKWISTTKGNAQEWDYLDEEVKPKILGLEAALIMDINDDTDKAEELLKKATSLYPEGDFKKLKVLINFKRGDIDFALKDLETPNTIAELNLKAAILLELNQVGECRELLRDTQFVFDSETYRVEAHLHLVEKDIEKAIFSIEKASEDSADWESFRFSQGVIYYYSALSPGALPDKVLAYPEPVNSSLVKRDPDSINNLRTAQNSFKEVLQSLPENHSKVEAMQGWRLASLINDPDKQEEALGYAQFLLKKNPSHLPIIFWLHTKGIPFDTDAALKALEKNRSDPEKGIDTIIAIVAILLNLENSSQALQVLEEEKSFFDEWSANKLWIFWQAQALVIQKEYDKAIKLIDENDLPINYQYPKLFALERKAKDSNEWGELERQLENNYKITKNSTSLLDMCSLKVQLKKWKSILKYKKDLISIGGSPEALRFYLYSLYHEERYDEFLTGLEKHKNLYFNQLIPSDIQSMRIDSLSKTGAIPQALSEAQKAVIANESINNLWNLAYLSSQNGYIYDFLCTVNKLLLQTDELEFVQLLGLSKQVYLFDRLLARRIFKNLLKAKIPDEYVLDVVLYSSQLNLESEKEIIALRKKLFSSSWKHNDKFRLISLEELMEEINKQNQKHTKIWADYEKSVAPIHFIAPQLGKTLVTFYQEGPLNNQEQEHQLQKLPTYAIAGIHPQPRNIENIDSTQLYIDQTSLLLADQLNLLDSVEQYFNSIWLPTEISPALVETLAELEHPQPSAIEARKFIQNLITNGKIKTENIPILYTWPDKDVLKEIGTDWLSTLTAAKRSNAYFLNSLPIITRTEGYTLPNELQAFLVNARAILESLYEAGQINKTKYQEIIVSSFGDFNQLVANNTPPINSKIYVSEITFLVPFIETNLMEILARNFEIILPTQEHNDLNKNLKHFRTREDTISNLKALIERVQKNTEKGIYKQVPQTNLKLAKKENIHQKSQFLAVYSLMSFPLKGNEIFWFDDRYFTSYEFRDKAPIVSIVDILKTLQKGGFLSQEGYYEKKQLLRSFNIRYIPLEREELLFHIYNSIREGEFLSENPDLQILKGYIANCLYDCDKLLCPIITGDDQLKYREAIYPVTTVRTIVDTIIDLWSSDTYTIKTCEKITSWILAELHFDHGSIFEYISSPGAKNTNHYVSMVTIVQMFTSALSIPSQHRDRRQEFFHLLWNKYLSKRITANPSLLQAIAEYIAKLIADEANDKAKNKKHNQIYQLIASKFIEDLPESLKQVVYSDSNLKKLLDVRAVTSIDGIGFEYSAFWRAIQKSIEGKQSKLKATTSKTYYTFESYNENGILIKGDGKSIPIRDADIALLKTSIDERENFVRTKRNYFDVNNEEFEKILIDIITDKSPANRVKKYRDWVDDNSGTSFYAWL